MDDDQLQDLLAAYTKLGEDLIVAKEEAKEAETLRAENQLLREELQRSQHEVQAAVQEVHAVRHQALSDVEELKALLDEEQNTAQSLRIELAAVRAELDSVSASASALQHSSATNKIAVTHPSSEAEELRRLLEAERAEAATEMEKLRSDHTFAVRKAAEATANARRLTATIERLEKTKKVQDEQLVEVRASLARAERGVDGLAAAHAEIAEHKRALALREENENAMRDRLNEQLAVSAELADRLDAIRRAAVVKARDGREAIAEADVAAHAADGTGGGAGGAGVIDGGGAASTLRVVQVGLTVEEIDRVDVQGVTARRKKAVATTESRIAHLQSEVEWLERERAYWKVAARSAAPHIADAAIKSGLSVEEVRARQYARLGGLRVDEAAAELLASADAAVDAERRAAKAEEKIKRRKERERRREKGREGRRDDSQMDGSSRRESVVGGHSDMDGKGRRRSSLMTAEAVDRDRSVSGSSSGRGGESDADDTLDVSRSVTTGGVGAGGTGAEGRRGKTAGGGDGTGDGGRGDGGGGGDGGGEDVGTLSAAAVAAAAAADSRAVDEIAELKRRLAEQQTETRAAQRSIYELVEALRGDLHDLLWEAASGGTDRGVSDEGSVMEEAMRGGMGMGGGLDGGFGMPMGDGGGSVGSEDGQVPLGGLRGSVEAGGGEDDGSSEGGGGEVGGGGGIDRTAAASVGGDRSERHWRGDRSGAWHGGLGATTSFGGGIGNALVERLGGGGGGASAPPALVAAHAHLATTIGRLLSTLEAAAEAQATAAVHRQGEGEDGRGRSAGYGEGVSASRDVVCLQTCRLGRGGSVVHSAECVTGSGRGRRASAAEGADGGAVSWEVYRDAKLRECDFEAALKAKDDALRDVRSAHLAELDAAREVMKSEQKRLADQVAEARHAAKKAAIEAEEWKNMFGVARNGGVGGAGSDGGARGADAACEHAAAGGRRGSVNVDGGDGPAMSVGGVAPAELHARAVAAMRRVTVTRQNEESLKHRYAVLSSLYKTERAHAERERGQYFAAEQRIRVRHQLLEESHADTLAELERLRRSYSELSQRRTTAAEARAAELGAQLRKALVREREALATSHPRRSSTRGGVDVSVLSKGTAFDPDDRDTDSDAGGGGRAADPPVDDVVADAYKAAEAAAAAADALPAAEALSLREKVATLERERDAAKVEVLRVKGLHSTATATLQATCENLDATRAKCAVLEQSLEASSERAESTLSSTVVRLHADLMDRTVATADAEKALRRLQAEYTDLQSRFRRRELDLLAVRRRLADQSVQNADAVAQLTAQLASSHTELRTRPSLAQAEAWNRTLSRVRMRASRYEAEAAAATAAAAKDRVALESATAEVAVVTTTLNSLVVDGEGRLRSGRDGAGDSDGTGSAALAAAASVRAHHAGATESLRVRQRLSQLHDDVVSKHAAVTAAQLEARRAKLDADHQRAALQACEDAIHELERELRSAETRAYDSTAGLEAHVADLRRQLEIAARGNGGGGAGQGDGSGTNAPPEERKLRRFDGVGGGGVGLEGAAGGGGGHVKTASDVIDELSATTKTLRERIADLEGQLLSQKARAASAEERVATAQAAAEQAAQRRTEDSDSAAKTVAAVRDAERRRAAVEVGALKSLTETLRQQLAAKEALVLRLSSRSSVVGDGEGEDGGLSPAEAVAAATAAADAAEAQLDRLRDEVKEVTTRAAAAEERVAALEAAAAVAAASSGGGGRAVVGVKASSPTHSADVGGDEGGAASPASPAGDWADDSSDPFGGVASPALHSSSSDDTPPTRMRGGRGGAGGQGSGASVPPTGRAAPGTTSSVAAGEADASPSPAAKALAGMNAEWWSTESLRAMVAHKAQLLCVDFGWLEGQMEVEMAAVEAAAAAAAATTAAAVAAAAEAAAAAAAATAGEGGWQGGVEEGGDGSTAAPSTPPVVRPPTFQDATRGGGERGEGGGAAGGGLTPMSGATPHPSTPSHAASSPHGTTPGHKAAVAAAEAAIVHGGMAYSDAVGTIARLSQKVADLSASVATWQARAVQAEQASKAAAAARDEVAALHAEVLSRGAHVPDGGKEEAGGGREGEGQEVEGVVRRSPTPTRLVTARPVTTYRPTSPSGARGLGGKGGVVGGAGVATRSSARGRALGRPRGAGDAGGVDGRSKGAATGDVDGGERQRVAVGDARGGGRSRAEDQQQRKALEDEVEAANSSAAAAAARAATAERAVGDLRRDVARLRKAAEAAEAAHAKEVDTWAKRVAEAEGRAAASATAAAEARVTASTATAAAAAAEKTKASKRAEERARARRNGAGGGGVTEDEKMAIEAEVENARAAAVASSARAAASERAAAELRREVERLKVLIDSSDSGGKAAVGGATSPSSSQTQRAGEARIVAELRRDVIRLRKAADATDAAHARAIDEYAARLAAAEARASAAENEVGGADGDARGRTAAVGHQDVAGGGVGGRRGSPRGRSSSRSRGLKGWALCDRCGRSGSEAPLTHYSANLSDRYAAACAPPAASPLPKRTLVGGAGGVADPRSPSLGLSTSRTPVASVSRSHATATTHASDGTVSGKTESEAVVAAVRLRFESAAQRRRAERAEQLLCFSLNLVAGVCGVVGVAAALPALSALVRVLQAPAGVGLAKAAHHTIPSDLNECARQLVDVLQRQLPEVVEAVQMGVSVSAAHTGGLAAALSRSAGGGGALPHPVSCSVETFDATGCAAAVPLAATPQPRKAGSGVTHSEMEASTRSRGGEGVPPRPAAPMPAGIHAAHSPLTFGPLGGKGAGAGGGGGLEVRVQRLMSIAATSQKALRASRKEVARLTAAVTERDAALAKADSTIATLRSHGGGGVGSVRAAFTQMDSNRDSKDHPTRKRKGSVSVTAAPVKSNNDDGGEELRALELRCSELEDALVSSDRQLSEVKEKIEQLEAEVDALRDCRAEAEALKVRVEAADQVLLCFDEAFLADVEATRNEADLLRVENKKLRKALHMVEGVVPEGRGGGASASRVSGGRRSSRARRGGDLAPTSTSLRGGDVSFGSSFGMGGGRESDEVGAGGVEVSDLFDGGQGDGVGDGSGVGHPDAQHNTAQALRESCNALDLEIEAICAVSRVEGGRARGA